MKKLNYDDMKILKMARILKPIIKIRDGLFSKFYFVETGDISEFEERFTPICKAPKLVKICTFDMIVGDLGRNEKFELSILNILQSVPPSISADAVAFYVREDNKSAQKQDQIEKKIDVYALKKGEQVPYVVRDQDVKYNGTTYTARQIEKMEMRIDNVIEK